jgi:hypothetical protein
MIMHAYGRVPLAELSLITLEKIQAFSDRSNTMVTIDAPLFGSVMIMNGRVLQKSESYVQPQKIGQSIGFPAYEDVVAEATRFWILDESGIRRLKCRDEMAKLLEQM